MVEILGVLAVVGVLTVGGLAGYSRAMENHRVNEVIDDLQTTVMALNDLRSSFSAIDKLGLHELLDAGVFPEGTVALEGEGEGVSLASGIVMGGVVKKNMMIFELAIPGGKYACQQMLTKDWASMIGASVIEGIRLRTEGMPPPPKGDVDDGAFFAVAPGMIEGDEEGDVVMPAKPSDVAGFCSAVSSVSADMGAALGISGQYFFVLMELESYPNAGGEILR
jgi:hypothetical protein